ncbi:MAG: DUF6265 family protein [bacterium]|jgi:hypothetical protein
MKIAILPVLGLLSLLLSISCQSPNSSERIGELRVLLGTWETSDGTIFTEHWNVVNDSILSGMGFSNYGTDTVFKESLKIFTLRDNIYYSANIKGHDHEVVFRLEKTGNGRYWKFVNPDHDYPNIIEYRLLDDSTLETRTSTLAGTKEKTFLMKKIK